jgi:protein-tyrosine phosphatase
MIDPLRVIFICYENICRSPMAEGIFTALLQSRGLYSCFSVTSAGTESYQCGSPPDFRAIETLRQFGIDISSKRACGIEEIDLYSYDWIFVMDYENYDDVLRRFAAHEAPKVYRVMEFVDERRFEEIGDPYYGSDEDFARVSKDLFLASEMILKTMISQYSFLEEADREQSRNG